MHAPCAHFSVYNFSPTEITQICTLVETWSSDSLLPVDGRRLTKQVRTYAINWHLLQRREDGRLMPGPLTFHPRYDLPIAALWQLVQPILNGQRSRGISLTGDSRWHVLNIYPSTHRSYALRDETEQVEILHALSAHGYLYVQMGGAVWEITNRQYQAHGA